jgi:hypothetical protein
MLEQERAVGVRGTDLDVIGGSVGRLDQFDVGPQLARDQLRVEVTTERTRDRRGQASQRVSDRGRAIVGEPAAHVPPHLQLIRVAPCFFRTGAHACDRGDYDLGQHGTRRPYRSSSPRPARSGCDRPAASPTW